MWLLQVRDIDQILNSQKSFHSWKKLPSSSRWRHNEHDGVSNHQPHDCLRNRLFRRRSEETSNLRVTGLCAGNSPVAGEFPSQTASNAENVSIWWRHHVKRSFAAYVGQGLCFVALSRLEVPCQVWPSNTVSHMNHQIKDHLCSRRVHDDVIKWKFFPRNWH